jgi:hypothetical protein
MLGELVCSSMTANLVMAGWALRELARCRQDFVRRRNLHPYDHV